MNAINKTFFGARGNDGAIHNVAGIKLESNCVSVGHIIIVNKKMETMNYVNIVRTPTFLRGGE